MSNFSKTVIVLELILHSKYEELIVLNFRNGEREREEYKSAYKTFDASQTQKFLDCLSSAPQQLKYPVYVLI